MTLRHGGCVSDVSSEPSGLILKALNVQREWLMIFVCFSSFRLQSALCTCILALSMVLIFHALIPVCLVLP